MSARRMLELEVHPGAILRLRTPWAWSPEEDRGRVALVLSVADGIDYCLTGAQVEELHQLTYELLAGRTRDPRLDVEDAFIRCGATMGPPGVALCCALEEGHIPVSPDGDSNVFHITSTGTYFREDPPMRSCGATTLDPTKAYLTCVLGEGHPPIPGSTVGSHIDPRAKIFWEVPF